MTEHYYELRCIDYWGFFTYYYFYSPRVIRSLATALHRGYAPTALRILIEDREETPVDVKPLPILNYFYKKYCKKAGAFHCGMRVNWEKEFKK